VSTKNQFEQLYRSVAGLLKEQDTLSLKERECSQFTLLTTIGGIKYLVGKGGISTMFYCVGDSERKVCYEEEMLKVIKKWMNVDYTLFCIFNTTTRKTRKQKYETVEDALKVMPREHDRIYGIGKERKLLYTSKVSIFDIHWEPKTHTTLD
jgi:hypothetical protein